MTTFPEVLPQYRVKRGRGQRRNRRGGSIKDNRFGPDHPTGRVVQRTTSVKALDRVVWVTTQSARRRRA